MINGINIVSVWVLDQDAAKDFYTTKLGFEVTTDLKLDNGMRWLTVRPQGSTTQDFLLMDPANSMLDEQTAAQVRALVAKGALSPGVMSTSDCRGDYETLVQRGVEFLAEPAERPYGIEAILRDDSGNWFSFTERTWLSPSRGSLARATPSKQPQPPSDRHPLATASKRPQPPGDRSPLATAAVPIFLAVIRASAPTARHPPPRVSCCYRGPTPVALTLKIGPVTTGPIFNASLARPAVMSVQQPGRGC